MTWEYIAGYGDGEGCLLFGIVQDKRPEKISGTKVTGWNIGPQWGLHTYDTEVLNQIFTFLNNHNVRVSKIYRNKQRIGQTKPMLQLGIYGWKNLEYFLYKILPYSISKKEQYELFINKLLPIMKNRPKNRFNKSIWTKETFIWAMEVIDEINSLKSRLRGRLNKKFFMKFWNM